MSLPLNVRRSSRPYLFAASVTEDARDAVAAATRAARSVPKCP